MIVLKTIAEIKAFQKKHGLVPDGVIGPKTKAVIAALEAKAPPKPSFGPWPKQSACNTFYGNPRGKGGAIVSATWYAKNIVMVKPPFAMAMGDTKITRFPMHKKCAEATLEWLNQVWANAGRDQKTIAKWGMDVFSGSFNYRVMRGGSNLSMHSWGVAIDFDAPRNGLADRTPELAKYREQIITPFLKMGGVWGGDWNGNGSTADERRCDGMHFQWAVMG